MSIAPPPHNLRTANRAVDSVHSARNGNILRILHVVNRLDMGGTEYGILKVIDGLGSDEFEQMLFAVRGFNPELRGRPGLLENAAVARGGEKGFQFQVVRLARIMRKYKPHIVHSRNWGAIEAIPAARLARVPVAIHSEHGYELDILAGLPLRQRLFRRGVYPMADAVFAVSDELRRYHERQAGAPAMKLRVIRNGVDTQRFAPRPGIRATVRIRLNLPAASFAIGSVGRVVPIKDHATMLKAAIALVKRGVEVRVLLAGSGPELPALQQFAEASAELRGRVLFLGACDNVPDLLSALDAFVLPSISEGMSNTILEAMASGLPVVATNVGGNPELVDENRSGWLFAPGHVDDLAHKLEDLAHLVDLRRRMGEAGRRRAVSEFSLERMIGNYRNLYRELAQRRGVLAESGA